MLGAKANNPCSRIHIQGHGGRGSNQRAYGTKAVTQKHGWRRDQTLVVDILQVLDVSVATSIFLNSDEFGLLWVEVDCY